MPTYFHHAFPPSPLVSPFLPRKIEFEYLQNAPEKIPKRICIIHRINIGRDKIITPRQSLSNKTIRRILLVSRMLQIPSKSEQKLCRNVETISIHSTPYSLFIHRSQLGCFQSQYFIEKPVSHSISRNFFQESSTRRGKNSARSRRRTSFARFNIRIFHRRSLL